MERTIEATRPAFVKIASSVTDREASAEIIQACRRGDRDAFRVLYEIYKDRVYSACLYFFHGDAAEAADVAQVRLARSAVAARANLPSPRFK